MTQEKIDQDELYGKIYAYWCVNKTWPDESCDFWTEALAKDKNLAVRVSAAVAARIGVETEGFRMRMEKIDRFKDETDGLPLFKFSKDK